MAPPVTLAWKASWAHKVPRVPWVHLDRKVHEAFQVAEAFLDRLAKTVLPETLVLRASQDPAVRPVNRDPKVLLVRLVHRASVVRPAARVQRERPAHKDRLVRAGPWVHKASPVHLVFEVHLDPKDHRVQWESKAPTVQMALKEFQGKPVQMGTKVIQVQRVQKVSLDLVVPSVLSDQRENEDLQAWKVNEVALGQREFKDLEVPQATQDHLVILVRWALRDLWAFLDQQDPAALVDRRASRVPPALLDPRVPSRSLTSTLATLSLSLPGPNVVLMTTNMPT